MEVRPPQEESQVSMINGKRSTGVVPYSSFSPIPSASSCDCGSYREKTVPAQVLMWCRQQTWSTPRRSRFINHRNVKLTSFSLHRDLSITCFHKAGSLSDRRVAGPANQRDRQDRRQPPTLTAKPLSSVI